MSCAKVISQFEILPAGDLGRRRQWTDAEKIRIVEESYRGHRQGSAVARKYGIARGLLTQWRGAYRKGLLEGGPVAFSPVEITPPPRDALVNEVSERVEITLANGRRLAIGTSIDSDTLARLVQVLERA
ncbi:MAG: IS66-like element accessory protein TnpA [Paracoccus sp. (in: a-proteobacteria)]